MNNINSLHSPVVKEKEREREREREENKNKKIHEHTYEYTHTHTYAHEPLYISIHIQRNMYTQECTNILYMHA